MMGTKRDLTGMGSKVPLKVKKGDYKIRIFLLFPPRSSSATTVWGTCSSSFCPDLFLSYFPQKVQFYLELLFISLKKYKFTCRCFLFPSKSTNLLAGVFCFAQKIQIYLKLEQQLFVLVFLQARLLLKVVFPVLVHLGKLVKLKVFVCFGENYKTYQSRNNGQKINFISPFTF